MAANSSDSSTTRPPSPLLDYMRLCRIPNVFTAIADSCMALAVAGVGQPNLPAHILIVFATVLLYTSGMVLNDVFDFAQDLEQRPQRPLPSGRIDRRQARSLGFLLWGAGGLAAPTAVWLQGGNVLLAAALAAGLMAAILTYDAGGKRSWCGPYLMGACRTLNILMVLSMATPESAVLEVFTPAMLLLAGGIGVYIAGITWFARTETVTASHRGMLGFALVHMLGGVGMVMSFPDASEPRDWYLPSTLHFFLLIMILAIPVARRAAIAIARPSPKFVQTTIKQGIFSLIVFDAGIALMVAPPYVAIAILALLIPTLLLGRWVYAT